MIEFNNISFSYNESNSLFDSLDWSINGTEDNNARVAYVPQEPVLFEHLSIYDNATFFKYLKARKKEFDPELFDEYSKVLGLDDHILRSNNKVTELSGGQRRKLSLLKALSLNPNILLLDEPTNGLDAQVKMDFLLKLRAIAKKYNILVLYVTHHFEEALLVGDKVHYRISLDFLRKPLKFLKVNFQL